MRPGLSTLRATSQIRLLYPTSVIPTSKGKSSVHCTVHRHISFIVQAVEGSTSPRPVWPKESHYSHLPGLPSSNRDQKRPFVSLPGPLIPPVVFLGLALTLWAYKCLMLVVFQNKIIYMPSVPPFSRSEKIGDYTKLCRGIIWKQETIKSLDGTKITLCVGTNFDKDPAATITKSKIGTDIVVVYFQGYDSSSSHHFMSNALSHHPGMLPRFLLDYQSYHLCSVS